MSAKDCRAAPAFGSRVLRFYVPLRLRPKREQVRSRHTRVLVYQYTLAAMLNDNPMGNPRNARSLIEAHSGHERPRRHEKHSFPLSFFNLRQHIRRKCNRRAAAAAPARVGVLRLLIIDRHAAVHMLLPDVVSPASNQIKKDGLSHISEIPGDDAVIICLCTFHIRKVLYNRIRSCRSHARPHVLRIFQTIIHDLPDCHPGDTDMAFPCPSLRLIVLSSHKAPLPVTVQWADSGLCDAYPRGKRNSFSALPKWLEVTASI